MPKTNKTFISNSIKWSIAFICASLFAFLLYNVSTADTAGFDNFCYTAITHFKSPALSAFMKFITEFGGAYVIIPATLLLLIFVKKPRLKYAIVGNLGGILLVNQALKVLIRRPRPDLAIRMIEQDGFSFPSGHSMCSMAFYGFLIYLVFRYCTKAKVRWLSSLGLGLLILTIGISRIYLGVHYASDVLAGFTLTIAYLIAYVALINFINYESRRRIAKSNAKTNPQEKVLK